MSSKYGNDPTNGKSSMSTGDWIEHCIATAALIVVLVWVWSH